MTSASTQDGRAADPLAPATVLVMATACAFAVATLYYNQPLLPEIGAGFDLGNRAGLVANQHRIYALSAEARSRLNTVFMTSYFLGGATGAAVAAPVAAQYGWPGLATTGASFALAALAAHLAIARSSE